MQIVWEWLHKNIKHLYILYSSSDVEVLHRNVQVLAEAIGRHILDMDKMVGWLRLGHLYVITYS